MKFSGFPPIHTKGPSEATEGRLAANRTLSRKEWHSGLCSLLAEPVVSPEEVMPLEKRGMGRGSGGAPMISGGSNFTCSSCIDLHPAEKEGEAEAEAEKEREGAIDTVYTHH